MEGLRMVKSQIFNVFIDSNIFIKFYELTNSSLNELKKINKLKSKIKIWLPDQVRDEVRRIRSGKLQESFKRNIDNHFSYPEYMRESEYFEKLKEVENNYKEIFKKVKEDTENRIQNENLNADSIIKELFQNAELIKETDDIYNAAVKRMNKLNPPGKNNSLGDRLIWESLLAEFPEKEDLYIISNDGDFTASFEGSKNNKKQFSIFLYKEWRENKNSNIYLFNSINEFSKEIDIDLHIEEEEEKEKKIQTLRNSTSFQITHVAVRELEEYIVFNTEQRTEILKALVENSQIKNIATDDDVNSFYRRLLYLEDNNLTEDEKRQINQLLFPQN